MRVTERAQRAVLDAKGEAHRLGHGQVGPEHLLLALLGDRESLAAATLGERGVEVETARRRVEETAGAGRSDGGSGEPDMLAALRLPTTKSFTVVLGLAGREAMELEHDRLGTEVLLSLEIRASPPARHRAARAAVRAAVDPHRPDAPPLVVSTVVL